MHPARVSLVAKDYESLDRALKDFRRLLDLARVIEEYKRHLTYQKPSVVRRQQLLRAIYREKMRRLREE